MRKPRTAGIWVAFIVLVIALDCVLLSLRRGPEAPGVADAADAVERSVSPPGAAPPAAVGAAGPSAGHASRISLLAARP